MTMLEHFIGYPMAAPESKAMRRLRFTFIGLAGLSGLSILGIDVFVSFVGRVIVGAVLVLLLLVTAVTALLFFFKKWRIDDQWLLEQTSEPEGKQP